MNFAKPIKDKDELQKFRDYYLEQEYMPRNYTLVVLGLNTALRISDLLSIRWRDVWNFSKDCPRDHLKLIEAKTKKMSRIALNKKVKEVLLLYKNTLPNVEKQDFLFPSPKCPAKPLSRSQAFRIVKHAADTLGIDDTISCHSMRKTFGYQACKQGIAPAILMNIYNHSTYQITKRYLDIDQDDRDETFINVTI